MLLSTMDEAVSGGGAGSSSDFSSSCSPFAIHTDSLAPPSAASAAEEDATESFMALVATPRLSVDQEDLDCIIDVEGTDDEDYPDCQKTTTKPTPSIGRRVYSAQFKLNVLDSYRQDNECRGNQRATARKYGIHRRQIQKWLQNEKLLRAAVNNNEPEEEQRTTEDTALNLCIKPAVEERLQQQQDRSWSPMDDAPGGASPQAAPSTGGKRRSFTLQFKLDVLEAFHQNSACRCNQRATARLFGINRRQVQKWLTQENQLRSEAALAPAGADRDTTAKRQRLGRHLWPVPSLPPPQQDALNLVVPRRSDAATPPLQMAARPEEASREPSKRNSYPLDFKLSVLDRFHHGDKCNGNQRAVAKISGINRRQVQKWLQQEEELRKRALLSPTRPFSTPSPIPSVSLHMLPHPFFVPQGPIGAPPVKSPIEQQCCYPPNSCVVVVPSSTSNCW